MNPSTFLIARMRLLIAGLAVLLAASCGSDPGVGSGGSGFANGVQSGTVTGFGSVVIDSVRFDDSGASVELDLDGAAPAALATDDLGLGMQVRVSFADGDVARRIEIEPQLVGLVEATAAAELTVSGQRVVVRRLGARATVFAGFRSLAQLLPGDRVTVYGLFDEFDRLIATRIERGTPAPAGLVKLTGAIRGFGLARRSLQIDGAQIAIDAQVRSDVPPADLRIGDVVRLWADRLPDGSLRARRIAMHQAAFARGETVRLAGFVRGVPLGGAITIGRIRVDLGVAAFLDGVLQDLAPGRFVVVTGIAEDDGIRARQIRFVDFLRDRTVEIVGTIRSFVDAGDFQIRSTSIDANGTSISFVGGTRASLANGVRVRVVGEIVDGSLQIVRIEFL